MNRTILKIFVVLLVFPIISCSEYSKLLKSSDADLKYMKALEYYKNEEYGKAMALFEDLIPIVRGTTRAEKVHYYYAYCNYKSNDYILAGHYFRDFAETYPKSEHVEEMAYMGAYCYYLDSPSPDLDQSNTYMAIAELQSYVSTYPNSDKVQKCNELIDNLRFKLETKSYNAAKLYFDLGEYKMSYYEASIIALNASLKDYPDTKYREDILYYITKAYFMIAENSIQAKQKERYEETIAAYNELMAEYPASKYTKDVEKILDTSKKMIEKLNNRAENNGK